ncbi:hypothetical protein [Erwinia amylovora]|uniref:hypothetical protein n=1 Tax=Erwinia amylovora TaxID=552 RepID=UPI0014444EA4|nr:hypothetical protein [Erwinia amylovora]
MKTTLSKIALIIIGVSSVAAIAANTIGPAFTGTAVVTGDNNSVTGSPRGNGAAAVAQIIAGRNNNLTNTDSSQTFGSDNTLNNSDVVTVGQGNVINNLYGNVYGDANTVDTGTSFGTGDVFGNSSHVSGNNDILMGSYSSITGSNSVCQF